MRWGRLFVSALTGGAQLVFGPAGAGEALAHHPLLSRETSNTPM
jgi:hypothetical protein